MTASYDPVAELRSHDLVSGDLPEPAEEVLGKLGRYQVQTFIKAKERADALAGGDVQAQSASDGALALAMARAMGWDKPAAEASDDVEAMIEEDKCACLCSTASGGGGGLV